MKINILGQPYEFIRGDLNNSELQGGDGVCYILDKKIIVKEKKYLSGETDEGKTYREEHVVRHELIHAFAEESGVDYGDNEALVDWIAHIIPHVNKVFNQLKEDGVI